jgi:hypothetical protein
MDYSSTSTLLNVESNTSIFRSLHLASAMYDVSISLAREVVVLRSLFALVVVHHN